MNGRMYDPVVARFLSPDPYVQAPDLSQNFNRYSYCLNNPLIYTDPSGEFIVPLLIGAAVGAYVGASIQSNNWNFTKWQSNAWQGAIAGAFVGATVGGMVSSSIGTTGMFTSAGSATKAWGITSSMLNSASINIAFNEISGGGWAGAWKSGIVGAASGGWSMSGGFGLANGKLAHKLTYQMIGTAGSSIGNNWASNKKPFSKVTLGVGPINLTLGKNQNLLQLKNNLGNLAFNTVGLANLAAGGKVQFDWDNLAPAYSEGFIANVYGTILPAAGTGAHVVFSNTTESLKNRFMQHEMRHVWQSRSFGDKFLLNYFSQGVYPLLRFIDQYYGNYFEKTAEYGF